MMNGNRGLRAYGSAFRNLGLWGSGSGIGGLLVRSVSEAWICGTLPR